MGVGRDEAEKRVGACTTGLLGVRDNLIVWEHATLE